MAARDDTMIEPSIDPLERARLRVVLTTVAINVLTVSLLTFAPWSDWRTGLALNFIDNSFLVGFVIFRRDALLARLILFGLAVGFAELPAQTRGWSITHGHSITQSVVDRCSGDRQFGCRWRGKLSPCNSATLACVFGNGSGALVCSASRCSVQLTFLSTRRWREEFIGGNTATAE